jgi:hypothetical protein
LACAGELSEHRGAYGRPSSSTRLDGQNRFRLAGPRYLPNGRTWDFAGGPQIVAAAGNLFGSITAGPTTMGLVTSNIGWGVMTSVGGTTL